MPGTFGLTAIDLRRGVPDWSLDTDAVGGPQTGAMTLERWRGRPYLRSRTEQAPLERPDHVLPPVNTNLNDAFPPGLGQIGAGFGS